MTKIAKLAEKSAKIAVDTEGGVAQNLSETKLRTVKAMALFGLERALTILSKRAQVLAQNLANANTPNYIRRDLPFYRLVKTALDKNSNPPISVHFDFSTPARADGNNTSPERELSELSKTALLYRTTLQLAAKEIAQLRSAIFEGRK